MCCEGLIDKLPQLDTCCCCCKVETGSKVIAWISMIGSLLYTIAAIVSAAQMVSNSAGTSAIAVTIATIIVIMLMCSMSFILLLGLYKEDTDKVKCWLRLSVCLFFTLVGLMIASIIAAAVVGAGLAIIGIVVYAVIIVLYELYMISVVKSHYHNMTNESFGDGRA